MLSGGFSAGSVIRSCSGGGGCFLVHFKNGMFLTVLSCQESANAAELLTHDFVCAFVRQAARGNSRRGKICCKKYLNFFVIPFQNRHLHRTPDGWDRAGKSPGAKRKGSGGQCASKWIKSGGRKVVCWIFEGDGNEFH